MLSFYYPTISSRKGERGTGGGGVQGGGGQRINQKGGGNGGQHSSRLHAMVSKIQEPTYSVVRNKQ